MKTNYIYIELLQSSKDKTKEVIETLRRISAEQFDTVYGVKRVEALMIAVEAISALTSEQSNMAGRVYRWIPCEERLPDEPSDWAMAGLEFDFWDEDLMEYNVMIEDALIPTTLYYAGDGKWYRDGNYYNVLAWMPLPPPYIDSEKQRG